MIFVLVSPVLLRDTRCFVVRAIDQKCNYGIDWSTAFYLLPRTNNAEIAHAQQK